MSYWPKMARDYAGRTVRLLQPLITKGGSVFPAGHVMKIRRKRGKLDLECLRGCKIKHNPKPKDPTNQAGHHFINRVNKYSVEFV